MGLSAWQLRVYNRIKSELANMDIGVLINNVGCSYEHAEYMHELDEARIEQLIQVSSAGLLLVKVSFELEMPSLRCSVLSAPCSYS